MSTIALNVFPAGITNSSSGGASGDAETLSEKYARVALDLLRSATGQARIGDSLASLDAMYRDCSVQNWDGEGAMPITLRTLREAEQLCGLLPSWVPVPEFLPEPPGAVALEWYRGKGRSYILSVSGRGYIEYAGLFGAGNELHGRVVFEDALPVEVIEQLRRFLGR